MFAGRPSSSEGLKVRGCGGTGATSWRRRYRSSIFPSIISGRRFKTFHGSTVTLETGTDVAERLARIARESEATLSTALLAAFQMVLHEWTGQDDVLVGCVTPGRRPEFARGRRLLREPGGRANPRSKRV